MNYLLNYTILCAVNVPMMRLPVWQKVMYYNYMVKGVKNHLIRQRTIFL